MTLNRQPLYKQICEELRARIESGELSEGHAVPTVRQIANDWGVANATAAKVLATLQTQGLVNVMPGVGAVVAGANSTGGNSSQERLVTKRSGKLHAEPSDILEVGWVAAPGPIAELMGVEFGEQVVKRARALRAGGRRVAHSVSWLPGTWGEHCPDLLKPACIPNATLGLIAEKTGIEVTSGREDVCAAGADEFAAEILGIVVGEPVMLSRNWFWGQNGELLELGVETRLQDRWSSYAFSAECS